MLRVLLVDDEPFVRQGMRLIVDWQGNGFKICGEASNVKEAIELLSRESFDVVFVDLVMPQINGIELVKHIRTSCSPDIFVVIVTGHFEHTYVKTAFEYGLTQYLLKPVQPDELLQVLRQISQANEQRQFDNQKRSMTEEAQIQIYLEKLAASCLDAPVPEKFREFLPLNKPYTCFAVECSNAALLLEYCKSKNIYTINLFSDQSGTTLNMILMSADRPLDEAALCSTADAILKIYERDDQKITLRIGKTFTAPENLAAAVQSSRDSNIYGTGNAKELLVRITNYIHIHYQEQITLNSLGSLFFINAAYLGQLFKQTYGIYLKEYLYKVRVEKAQTLICEHNCSIKEAAEKTGFQNANQLIKYFTKEYGTTPGKYQKGKNS